MSKAVLISIQPKWCELIASGKKTVEVRKTKPRLETPFKVYIYCTKPIHYYKISKHLLTSDESLFLVNGKVKMCDGFGVEYEDREYKHLNCKVIGEFVCDRIYNLTPHFDKPDFCNQYICDWKYGEGTACLSFTEMNDYLKGKQGYGWHISDLVIYDKPKELGEYGEFYVWKKCNSCRETGYESTACCFDIDCKVPAVISRPPQSWCYVEEMSGDEKGAD